MIVYLKNHEIDRELWDACISASPACKPYAFSWYLDIMSPGWEALIDDDYDSVFPLPAREKFGIKYLATPIFLQQLGVFSPDNPEERSVLEFIDFMPQFYRLIDLAIGQKICYEGFSVTERSNFEIDLSGSYEDISGNYTHPCRRNVEKSNRSRIEFAEDVSASELVELFIAQKTGSVKNTRERDFNRLKELISFCLNTGKGRIIGVRKTRKQLIFGQFILEQPGYINLFFGVNAPESREKRINYHFIDKIIRENAGSGNILDFAGSSIPSIASFMESFGSINKPYYRIFRNTLPWPIRMLKR